MPRKPSEKNRAWEKERRERLNKSFEQLAKLLPQYDPSITWTKIEIIQKSIDHIEELHQKHVEYLKDCDPETLRQHNELIDALKYYQSRNGQLADLLVKAKISLPTFKLPKFLADNPEFSDENRLGDINVKSVGRPGKYANKISKDDAEKIGKQQTELNSSKSTDATAKEQSPEDSSKQPEAVPPPADAPVTVTNSGGAAPDALIKTAVLVPVLSLQTQQPLNPPVITSEPAPTSGPPVPPLVNVTNLNSAQKVPKTATAAHIFNYAREKNGKIKILPQPQIKLYFRRADGKIPIPVLKKRVTPTKRKRKCKRRVKASSSGIKRIKTEADTRENCKKVCQEQEKDEPAKKIDEQIEKPCENRLDEENSKNKENMPLCSNKEESDYIATLDIPQNESNPNSVSPTAAFLMSFPVVNTSTGKLPEMMDDSEILTPNNERKDSGVDNLENLNHFFTTKEYTKFCAENNEKNPESGKEAKQAFNLPQVAAEEPKSKNLFEYFNSSVQETAGCNQNVSTPTKVAENNAQNEQKHLTDALTSSRHLFSSSVADPGYNYSKQTPNTISIPSQISNASSISNPVPVQSFANSSASSCTASTMPLFSTFAPTSKPFFTTTTHSSFLSSQLHLATAASTVSTTNTSSFLSSQLHLSVPTPTCVPSPSISTSFLSSRLHLPLSNSSSMPSSTTQSITWSSPNIFVTNNNTTSNSITTNVSNYSFWPNTFTSPSLNKNPTVVSHAQSETQNLFGPTTTTYNSFSTSLAPRCTPLPLENSVKIIHSTQPTPTTSTTTLCKPFSRKSNLPTSKPVPFLDSEIPCLQTTMAMDTTFSNTLTTNTVSTSSAVSKSSFPPIMSTSSSGYANPTFTPIHNRQKDISNYAPSSLPPFRTDSSSVSTTPLTLNTSTQGGAPNLLSNYTQSISQSLSSSTYTPITQNSVSNRNYYYPQTPSNFNLGLTTPTTIPSQLPTPQTVLPYPSIPYPAVTADYKPSFTFSLTPSTTTYCKQSEAVPPLMPPPVKCSTLPNIPYAARENDFVQKPVFNPFESSPSYKPPNLSVTKAPNNSYTSTNFTFSLTNPKTTLTTTNEAKPATAGVPKVQQQFENFDRSYKSATPQQFLPFNQQTGSPQKNPSFTFALTKTTKTPQKATNSFSIDATLGIGSNSPCFIDSNKKTTNGSMHPTSDTNLPLSRSKANKAATNESNPEQMNNFYSYNQRTEKFVQKSHINWMTSSEGLPNTTDFVQSSSSRMLPESYHPFTTGEDNYPSWSPSKMYDSSHLIPPGTTVSNFYGDIGYNAPSYSLAPTAVDTQKADKAYKTSTSSSNQANFFSVSQLVDQTPSKHYDAYQKKVIPGKSKDHRKQTCVPNTPQTLYPEGTTFGHPKPSVSNSYSAEALISKKEKHRNFGGVASSDLFPMDATAPLYNHTEPAEQSYNSNYFYNYPTNQNYVQDTDYLGAYSTDAQFGKPINKHTKKLPPPAPPPPPPNLISYDSNYFPVPLAVNSPLMGSQHPSVDGYDPLHYNHSGNFQTNSWGPKAPGIGGYHQSQPFQASDLAQINSDNAQSTSHSAAPGNLTNFNMSTICPEINDKVVTPNVW